MSGDTSAVVEDFDGPGGEAHFDLLANEPMWNAVEVPLDLDVIVDVHAGALALRVLVAGRGQRPECRPVHGLEQRTACALEFLEGTIVERIQETPDLAVEIGQAEERVVPQRRQDPSLDDLNRGLNLSLVTWFARTSGQYRRAVVNGEFLVRGVDVWIVATRSRHTGA